MKTVRRRQSTFLPKLLLAACCGVMALTACFAPGMQDGQVRFVPTEASVGDAKIKASLTSHMSTSTYAEYFRIGPSGSVRFVELDGSATTVPVWVHERNHVSFADLEYGFLNSYEWRGYQVDHGQRVDTDVLSNIERHLPHGAWFAHPEAPGIRAWRPEGGRPTATYEVPLSKVVHRPLASPVDLGQEYHVGEVAITEAFELRVVENGFMVKALAGAEVREQGFAVGDSIQPAWRHEKDEPATTWYYRYHIMWGIEGSHQPKGEAFGPGEVSFLSETGRPNFRQLAILSARIDGHWYAWRVHNVSVPMGNRSPQPATVVRIQTLISKSPHPWRHEFVSSLAPEAHMDAWRKAVRTVESEIVRDAIDRLEPERTGE